MQIAVHGLWHLGCVTVACLAEAGFQVVGIDPRPRVVADLCRGVPPLLEPGLPELLAAGLASGRLRISGDPREASDAAVLWVTFDTPVNEEDVADFGYIRNRFEEVAPHLRPGTLVLVSSQVPVGFTRSLEAQWQGKGLRFACAPENLRLGKALECFRRPERVVIGRRQKSDEKVLAALFAPFCARLEWMSVESAEMTKHALNAFLATSVTFINEVARLCEAVGADAKEVERGLKSEGRIGPGAYLSPGGAFAGGTLARDVQFLTECGRTRRVRTPLMEGVWASNDLHKGWIPAQVRRLLGEETGPVAAVLGLTYKPGTSTLRRSEALQLCGQLTRWGVRVRAHDPAVQALPEDTQSGVELCATAEEALLGADVAVLATAWPDYRRLRADDLVRWMRRAQLIDPNHFLDHQVGADPRVTYVATGRLRSAA
ncbi:MAG: nucleotide sugar dehydrogenase [Planctomycetes bacterium]|nr:nucleotide sugar dehydrogenase [Planctomycetota bacterium]